MESVNASAAFSLTFLSRENPSFGIWIGVGEIREAAELRLNFHPDAWRRP